MRMAKADGQLTTADSRVVTSSCENENTTKKKVNDTFIDGLYEQTPLDLFTVYQPWTLAALMSSSVDSL
jgi:hypothetical protein